MKIHVFGCSGSGKTWISNKLAAKYGIPHYDLDDIFWDNTKASYGTKTPVNVRGRLLDDILRRDDWIIEGVYYSWLSESFEKADSIIVLDLPGYVYKLRIIRRFVRRKLGVEPGKKETLKSLINLLKWTDTFKTRICPTRTICLNRIRIKLQY